MYSQQVTEAQYSGNTNYNSLQATFEERLRRGMSLLVNYTWSKALDNLPYNASVTAIGANNSYVLPTYEPNFKRLDYGPSDFDHRHVLAISYVWELPKVSSSWGPLRYILNDWQANGIIQFRSGDPLTIVSSSSDNSKTGQMRDRAVFLGGNAYGNQACATVTGLCKGFLNPSVFTNNPLTNVANPALPLRYGNVQKGAFYGPQFTDRDASLMRHFTFTERWKAEFRAEFFNMLNHPNFGDPATALAGLRRITSAPDSTTGYASMPRIGRFSEKKPVGIRRGLGRHADKRLHCFFVMAMEVLRFLGSDRWNRLLQWTGEPKCSRSTDCFLEEAGIEQGSPQAQAGANF